MNRFLYSLTYLLLLGVPAVFLGYLVKDNIDFSALILLILIVLIVGGIFDIWAVRQGKKDNFFIWEYNSKSILGFKIYGVPVEDFVFFLVLTPCFIVTVYEAVKIFLSTNSLRLMIAISIFFLLISYNFVYKHAIGSKKE
ncbi:MAG: lycopene cyclase domain-containing protein [Patescibacteria group bacterium]|jgi:lycopene cyclase domain-containing protein